jgi:hypothetical protein
MVCLWATVYLNISTECHRWKSQLEG